MTKKRTLIFAVALLLVAVTAAGCLGFPGFSRTVAFADMKYTRPDMQEFSRILEKGCELAASGTSLDDLVDSIVDFYAAYDKFYTSYALANIKYSCNMSDIYWEGEYSFCLQNTTTVDAGLDSLYYALADSPFRAELESDDYFGEGFFDSYEGESIWDETFTALMEHEADLIDQYYDLSGQSQEDAAQFYSVYAPQLAQIYVELVALRQQIAAYLDYDSYPQFAYDYYYYRDYTAAQEAALLEQIRLELVPLYEKLDFTFAQNNYSSQGQTFSFVKNCADKMGGTMKQAFRRLEKDGLYDIGYGKNKYPTSFETYIYNYNAPFVFMCAAMDDYDKLTFAHEFGHFSGDYACGGSTVGVDVAEVHSQGMEYLCLCYGEDTDDLEWLKMADCLCTYVEQAALASFERQVYDLTEDALTVENVSSLYLQTCQDFGFGELVTAPLEFTTVSHYYTNPMYVISYVVSNDAAFQIYLRERETPGEGLALYEACLASDIGYFLEFEEAVGLESPFGEAGIVQVRQTLEEILYG